MRILDRQRYKDFFKAYVICFTALVSLYVVIDAFGQFDEFAEVTSGTAERFRYMGYYYLIRLTTIYDRLSGVITMMAAVFTVTWMQKNNELLAMLAAGIGTKRVIRPVWISAILVSALGVFNQEYLVPAIGGDELQRSPDDTGTTNVGVSSRYDINDILIHGKDGDRATQTVTPFNASLPPGLFGVSVEIAAKEGRYIPDSARRCAYRGGWLLRGVTITPGDRPLEGRDSLLIKLDPQALGRFPPPVHRANQAGAAYFLRSNLSFASITHKRRWYQFAPTIELVRGLTDPGNEPEWTEMAVFLHARALRPLLSLALLFLSLPLVLGGDGRGMFINLGLSLGTSALFYAVLFVMQFLGNNAILEPELAAWAPLIAFGTLAAARWDTIRT